MPLAQPVSEDISGDFFISQESSHCHTHSIVTTEDRILKLLSGPDYTPLDVHGLRKQLHLPRPKVPELRQILGTLEREGRIARIKGDRYASSLDADLVPGRIRINRQGIGLLEPDDSKLSSIRIPADRTATAMHGDRVLVRREASGPPSRKPQAHEFVGKVVRVLESARNRLVGTLQRSRQFLYVIPDDTRIPHDIYVPPARDLGREPGIGDKVVVELKEWKSRHTNPEGEIIEILGPPNAEGVDMLSILREYDLPLHFPEKVLQEARSFGDRVRIDELKGRTDCRSHPVVTIDPDDAKDFDDALSFQRTADGRIKLWVHIADVSHYVKVGTALDQEARKRGNSTYLVDRVLPMLPEALSNELCSLKPNVDRLTKCVEFLLSPEGRVIETSFSSAVINSKRRFSYKEVLSILQGSPADPLERMLHQAHVLAQRIRRARMKAGSLDLDFPETKIRLDERGRISRIERVENDVSHQLIEEFMLLANEAAAIRLKDLKRPAIYRVHEPPDETRLEEFRQDVINHQIRCGNLRGRAEIQRLLLKLNSFSFGPALKIGFLRSMMRARYQTEPLGHYGLAKANYTHFTSPIRRYVDLAVHRALFEKSGRPADQSPKQIADHISKTERLSDDAERSSKRIKLLHFLADQLAAKKLVKYEANVIDVRNFGFFVDVPDLGISGLVPLSTLKDEFYQFNFARKELVGRRTRRLIKLGDRVRVKVSKVDFFKKQIDFGLAE